MKRLLFILLISCFSFVVNAQIITTFAGGGTTGIGDGGPATAAIISDPIGGILDKSGNYFFVSKVGNRIRKVDYSGIITTIAGTGVSGYSGDGGLATAALLKDPEDVTLDTAGNLYVTDAGNNCVRKINGVTGIITTIAGNGIASFSGDGGLATAATLNNPLCLCFDTCGNLFITDNQNNKVRKINTAGIISTYAGTGIYGYSGDSGPASSAQLWLPWGLTIDKMNNLFVADWGNFRIRKISDSKIITTYAGSGSTYTYNGDNIAATSAQCDPGHITMDKYGNLFIAEEFYNYRVRMINSAGIISTVAGNGIAGHSGDGGYATDAEFDYPGGIAIDSCQNLYITDIGTSSGRIRKVNYVQCDYLFVKNENVITQMNIYPNPTNDQLQIDNIATPTNYNLQNIVGATLQHGTLKEGSNSISLSALPTGIYLLELIDEKGNRTVKKIIKE